jgi:hypothetical protein
VKNSGIDWINLIAFSASFLTIMSVVMGVFYRYFHKDFENVHKDIEILKEDNKNFREEIKSIRERTDRVIIEQNARMDGIYNLLLKKFE